MNLKDEVPLQTAIDILNTQVINKLRRELPPSYSTALSGQAKDLDRTWDSLKWSFLLAVIITYLLMCSLYEASLTRLQHSTGDGQRRVGPQNHACH